MKQRRASAWTLVLFAVGLVLTACSERQEKVDAPAIGQMRLPQETSFHYVNYSMAEPIPLDKISNWDEFEKFTADYKIAVVKFGAPWCDPCKLLKPDLERQAGYFQTEDVRYAEVEFDKAPEVCRALEVGTIPDVRVFYNGEQVAKVVGLEPERLASVVDRYCRENSESETNDQDSTEAEPAATSEQEGAATE